MKKIVILFVVVIIALTSTNCKKDKVTEPEPAPNSPAATTGNLKIYFEAMVGDSALVLSTSTYTNQAADTFNVTVFKYYISNIKITKADNSVFTEPNSYHLIDHSDDASLTINIPNVPYGSYKAIEFMIGVDSAKSSAGSGAQTGALDPANGMYWMWNSGYIMAKMEGKSNQSGEVNKNLKFHIGGFSGPYKTMRVVSPSFGTATADVTSSVSPTIHMKSDLYEWFTSPTNINFSTAHTVHMPDGPMSAPSYPASTIANNYADMFTVEHIHN